MFALNEQQLIDLITPDLPIRVFPAKELLPILRKQYSRMEISLSTEMEIHAIFDSGNSGGVVCEISPPGLDKKKRKEVLICSLTHLRIKKGEPHYAEIVRYQLKRVKKLRRQNKF
jgi:hypothetical protein